MGVFIYLNVEKSVTQEEWKNVYDEALELAGKLPLANIENIDIDGIETACAVKCHEETDRNWTGWCADCDTIYYKSAEPFYLRANLVEKDEDIDPESGDALMGILPSYLDYDFKDKRFDHHYSLWGNKTQGEPYHIYLLAIAALIEHRLKNKAIVYGDITRGQLKEAVKIANSYLDTPIDISDRCYIDRFYRRVTNLPLSPMEKLKVFIKLFLGTKDAEFGQFLKENFSEEVVCEYWKYVFDKNKINSSSFSEYVSKYLLWGFDLSALTEYVDYIDSKGDAKYEAFIKRIMDAKLHIKEKDCKDILEIDQEDGSTYGISTIMMQFFARGAKNKKVDRYIPIEEIRSILNEKLSDKCDVNRIIDEYLEKETDGSNASEDLSASFNKTFEKIKDDLKLDSPDYDITFNRDLIFYKNGNTITPVIQKNALYVMEFLNSLQETDSLKRLLNSDWKEIAEWVSDNNHHYIFKKEIWEQFYSKIKNNKENFRRYYPLFRVQFTRVEIEEICKALFLNDELYEYLSKILVAPAINEHR